MKILVQESCHSNGQVVLGTRLRLVMFLPASRTTISYKRSQSNILVIKIFPLFVHWPEYNVQPKRKPYFWFKSFFLYKITYYSCSSVEQCLSPNQRINPGLFFRPGSHFHGQESVFQSVCLIFHWLLYHAGSHDPAHLFLFSLGLHAVILYMMLRLAARSRFPKTKPRPIRINRFNKNVSKTEDITMAN